MPYFFKDLELKNYRIFKKLNITDFQAINIFGGKNGSGKTTILEALFSIIDINSPNALLRYFGFRRLPGDVGFLIREKGEISIESKTKKGTINIVAKINDDQDDFIDGNFIILNNIDSAIYSKDSMRVVSKLNDIVFTEYSYRQNNVFAKISGSPISTKCVMINSFLKFSPMEESERLSRLKLSSLRHKKSKDRYRLLVKNMQLINPEIKNLETFSIATQPLIHAVLSSGKTLPVPLLGEGAQTLLSILLAIYDVGDGVVFVDEFESSIYYKALPAIWKAISIAAEEMQCQIFAATHSRECITSAANGVEDNIPINYYRIGDSFEGETEISVYGKEDLLNADLYNAEVR